MTSQVRVEQADRAPWTKQLTYRATENAAYITLVIGYLITVLTATHLTVVNVLTFTGIQILYAAVFWWMTTRSNASSWQVLLGAGILLLLAFASGMLATTGLYFDWLLYFVTVGIYFSLLSLRSAIIVSIILYIASGINSALIDTGTGLSQNWPSLLAGFAFVAAFALGNKLLNAQREQTEALLHQLEESNRERELAHTQLQQYANEVEELTVDRERTRMAREIHDTLGHYLTILSIQLETISKLQERDPSRAIVEVAEARRVAAQAMQEVRNAVAALRPYSIATLSLPEALTRLGNEFRGVASETELTLDLDTQLPPLSPDLQLALYRAAQEALTNVRKHAHATKVLLRLRYEDEEVELVVLDNGAGPVTDESKQYGSGFGLIGLRERVELLGGQVAHGPAEPTGYRVTIRVHVPSRSLLTNSEASPSSVVSSP